MHRLHISHLGPIENCEIEVKPFMVFTGEQATGKSTVVKAIQFFRTIKDELRNMIVDDAIMKKHFEEHQGQEKQYIYVGLSSSIVINRIITKFIKTFDRSGELNPEMHLIYEYTPDVKIEIFLSETGPGGANRLQVKLCPAIEKFLNSDQAVVQAADTGVSPVSVGILEENLADLFNDDETIVFIPAGRNMMPLLSDQWKTQIQIVNTLQETENSTLDACTQDYVERIMTLRSEFKGGIAGLRSDGYLYNDSNRIASDKTAQELIDRILHGRYLYSDGQEVLEINEKPGKTVRISRASSGQQAAVWITNLLYYYMNRKAPAAFIIEEPESNLFPAAQKAITELIALAGNLGNSVIVTTHSPYILGAMNNLLFAGNLGKQQPDQTSRIIDPKKWIEESDFSSFLMRNGQAQDIFDKEIHMLDNAYVDAIADVMNDDFDQMVLVDSSSGSGDS